MKDLVKLVFLLIAGGCFGTIAWFTFIDPELTTDQFMNLVYAGIALVAVIAITYAWYQLRKGDQEIEASYRE